MYSARKKLVAAGSQQWEHLEMNSSNYFINNQLSASALYGYRLQVR